LSDRAQARAELSSSDSDTPRTRNGSRAGASPARHRARLHNVSGGILAYGEMLLDESPANSPRKRYAQNVLTAATRGRAWSEQILPTAAATVKSRSLGRSTSRYRGADPGAGLSLPVAVSNQWGLAAQLPQSLSVRDATRLHQVEMKPVQQRDPRR